MKKELVFGILGIGRIGKMHAENIIKFAKGARVKTATDIYLNDAHKEWASEHGIEVVGTDPELVFGDPEINAVAICSSTDTHCEFIIRAAEQGKAIFCEKPIGANIDDINKALEAVEKAGVPLQLGFVRRFDHNFLSVKNAILEGAIGKPEVIKICSRDPVCSPISYLSHSGGLFFDMMIHDFDMASFLAGSPIDSVYSEGAVLTDPEVATIGDVDTAIACLRFKSGIVGVIDNSRRTGYGYDQRVEVHGEKGTIIVDNDRPNTALFSTVNGINLPNPIWDFQDRYHDAFVHEIQSFVDSVLNGTKCSPDGIDGLNAVLVADAATKSYTDGVRVAVADK